MWSTTQLAREGNVTRARVRQLCLEGKLPGSRKWGRDWMIPDGAAQVWLKTGRRWKRKKKPDWLKSERDRCANTYHVL